MKGCKEAIDVGTIVRITLTNINKVARSRHIVITKPDVVPVRDKWRKTIFGSKINCSKYIGRPLFLSGQSSCHVIQ